MSQVFKAAQEILEDDVLEEIDWEKPPCVPDDMPSLVEKDKSLKQFVNALTRIGAEVDRLRAEVNGLLEQNSTLVETFGKLRDVVASNGQCDLDDFELACEVLEQRNINLNPCPVRKTSH